MKTINSIIKNYKTTVPGLLALLCVALNFARIITNDQLTIGMGILISAGLIGAKDHSSETK